MEPVLQSNHRNPHLCLSKQLLNVNKKRPEFLVVPQNNIMFDSGEREA